MPLTQQTPLPRKEEPKRNPRFHKESRITFLDTLPVADIVEMFNCEQIEAVRAVGRAEDQIKEAAALVVRQGGRLIFAGAGTSGRLGVMNAAECIPTFGTHPDQFQAIMAGDSVALTRSVEGAEDNEKDATEALRSINIRERDVVCGIAASGTTPYAVAAIRFARLKRISTIFITGKPVPKETADVIIHLDVGPEIIHGSTRMKAGTAQKITLDTLTSTVNVLRFRTYGGLMVDMQISNNKLRARAIDMLQLLTGLDKKAAAGLIDQARAAKCPDHGPTKIAAVMHVKRVDAQKAIRIIKDNDGSLRKIIGDIDYTAEKEDPA